MDDEKSMTEKLTDALGRATDSVKSTIGSLVETASNAAQHAMEPNAKKVSGQTVPERDPDQVAATANEQVYLPPVTDAVAAPMPLVAAPQPAPKPPKSSGKSPRSKSSAGKTTAAPNKAAAKKSKKTAKKPVAKSAPKKSQKKSAKKTKKRAVKTAAKKAARKSAKPGRKSKR